MTRTRSSATAGRNVAVVLGTRPEIIKLARVIDLLGSAARVIHTGQHYDDTLSGSFFAELELDDPAIQLSVGGLSRAGQIAGALADLDREFAFDRPDVVVVQGDTNATVAGALAANAAGIPLVHVEAGLRSHDRAMPEEHNRVVTDHLSDVLCTATFGNIANLRSEGIQEGIAPTGNTVVEAVERLLPTSRAQAEALRRHGVSSGRYVLATIHRPENTDQPQRLSAILRALQGCGQPVVLPLHPRTRAAVERFGLGHLLASMTVVDPLGSGEFLSLANQTSLLVSDSGGVQEECTVLKRPLVVVRNSTERPESLEHFAQLVGPDEVAKAMAEVLDAGPELIDSLRTMPSPFGDGRASMRIVEEVHALVGMEGSAA